ENRGSVERHLVYEIAERGSDLLNIVIVVEVLAVDVRDGGDDGTQLEEGTVALVRLDHHEVALADSGVRAAHGSDTAADNYGRIEAGLAQNGRNHGRRRGLAVAARDGDAVFQTH